MDLHSSELSRLFHFQVLFVSLVIVCCSAQLCAQKGIPSKYDQILSNRFAQLIEQGRGAQYAALGNLAPLVEQVAVKEPVAVAPAVAVAEAPAVDVAGADLLQPVGQLQLRGYRQLAAAWNPVHAYRTQEMLPIQDLAINANPELLNVSPFSMSSM